MAAVRLLALRLVALVVVVAPLTVSGAFAAGGVGRDVSVHPRFGVEVVGSRTRFSRTYDSREFGRATVVSVAPQNFRDAGGAWRPIDSELVGEQNQYRNRSNSHRLELPVSIADPIRLSEAGRSVALQLLGGTGALAEVAGAVAEYRDALPHADLRLVSEPAGLKLSVFLRSAAAQPQVSFAVDVSEGLTVERSGVSVRVAAGEATVFALSGAFARDAAGGTARVRVELARLGGATTLTLALDPAWLAAPGRRFPVEIDPLLGPGASPDCTLEAGAAASTSFCAASTLEVGYDGTDASRAVLKFDVSSIPRDAVVLNARLDAYLASASTAATTTVAAHAVTRAFTSSVTWNSYDGSNAWTNAGGDYEGTAADARSITTAAGWKEWYPTKLVQRWVNQSLTNNGILLKQSSEATTNVLSFNSSQTSTEVPQLIVYWNYRVGERPLYTFAPEVDITDRLNLKANVANGDLSLRLNAFDLKGGGLNLPITLYYSQRAGMSWYLGAYWRMSIAPFVQLVIYGDGSVRYDDGTGAELRFDWDGTTFTTPAGLDATLTKNSNGTYTLEFHRSKLKWHFRSWGGADHVTDRNGNKLTFTWSGGHMTEIRKQIDGQSSDSSYATFAYTTHTASGATVLDSITDFAGRTVSFDYGTSAQTTSALLTSFTDAEGEVTSFSYSTAYDELEQITDPLGNDTELTYVQLQQGGYFPL